MDDVGSNTLLDSPPAVRGVRTWHDGSGNRVEAFSDGRLFCAGEFLGYRDERGRVTDGSGNLLGRLDDDGAYFAANGQFQTRHFL